MSAGPGIPAIVPAAGESRRMGRPKLLVEMNGVPVIARVVAALRDGGAAPVIVIAPPHHATEGPPIRSAAAGEGAMVVAPEIRPAQMRESVELGLIEAARQRTPDGVVLTPADSPALTLRVVAEVLAAWRSSPGKIVVACSQGRHAHPLVLPWKVASRIPSLPPGQGVNALLDTHRELVLEVEVSEPGLADDFNTPEDLGRWDQMAGSVLNVRLFAVAKQLAGRAEIPVKLDLPATVAAVRLAIAMQYPELAVLAPRILVAVDSEYAGDETMVSARSKVALIPPVSGGEGKHHD